MTKNEELRLIRLAASGDRSAAETFIKAHQKSLYGYLVRMSGRPDVAEDVTQEAFVRVLSNLDRFDPRFRFSTWLFTIARRLYLNFCEKRRPSSAGEAVGGYEGSAVGPQAAASDAEHREFSRDAIQRALLELSLEQREVLVLFHQLEWPIWLIADHLGMPEGTVKSHLHRGRRRLRDTIEAQREHRAETPEEVWL